MNWHLYEKCDCFYYTNEKDYLCDDVSHGGLLFCFRGHFDSGSIGGGSSGGLSWDWLSNPFEGMVGL